MYIKSHRSTLSRDQNTTVEIRGLVKITYPVKSTRIPLVRTSSELAVRRPGKDPERAVPSPPPGRHEGVRSRHVSSPPTVN
ncbi:unnamed protein product, partial [Brassica rapa subsp. narinosa]